MAVLCACALAVGVLAFFAGEARGAANLPQGFTEQQVVSGLNDPSTMTLAPDGRIFVAEQPGRLRVIENGRLLPAPFVDLSSIVDSRGERGLLGIAFDPAFASNGYVYLYYTQKATPRVPAHNRVVRFTASGDGAVPGSGRLILRLNNLTSAQNHNGGALNFGTDGRLYIAVGDNANGENSQTVRNLLGKMLRINKDGSIPRDNPFYRNKRVVKKNKAIWARGLRNPYTFAVQPGSGRIYINDVGQRTWEEINPGIRGANYGWPRFEGPESNRRYVPPVFAYRHEGDPATTGCAITGGAFYNPQTAQFPAEFVGDYLFADFCGGWIRRYDPATNSATGFATGIQSPVDLDVAPDGSLYYLERGTGSVYRVQHPN
jgi:glucose/arabinose dehydrogenase